MSEPQLISGKWYNQLGSRLDLHIDDTGLISGFFRSSVGEIEVGIRSTRVLRSDP